MSLYPCILRSTSRSIIFTHLFLVIILRFTSQFPISHPSHLGHDLPDSSGNRYCINLVSVAGRPVASESVKMDG